MTEFVSASGIITVLVVIGGSLCLLKRRRRLGAVCAVAAAVLYLLLASGPIAHALLRPLENQHPPVLDGGNDAIDTVVVLTAYGRIDQDVPVSSYVNAPSAFRILEAARLLGGKPERKIIISGGGGIPAAMQSVLLVLGVREDQMALESDSLNTFESALHLRDRLSGRHFYLVTSAGHMPRSMRVFQAQGLQPVPAPTDFLTKRGSPYWSGPTGHHLFVSDLALHEYLGLLWYTTSGRF